MTYYNLDCYVNYAFGRFMKKPIITGVNIKCVSITAHIVIFYKRGSFLWTGKDLMNKVKIDFFDTERAFNRHVNNKPLKELFILKSFLINFRFKISIMNDSFLNLINVPSNIKRFLFDYENSKFYECNHELGNMTKLTQLGLNNTQNMTKNQQNTLNGLIDYAKTFETFFIKYTLVSDTLSGMIKYNNYQV